MKWIFVWLTLATIVVAAAAGSCSINHRSDRLECPEGTECPPDRECVEGVCIPITAPPDGAPPDTGEPTVDAYTCPPQCTTCIGQVCIIDCSAAGANCTDQVRCPKGFSCDIRCNTDSACRSGIHCLDATECTIQCGGRDSCRGVMCGTGGCFLNCTGMNSCETVACEQSCACDVKCAIGNNSCQNVQCTSDACEVGRGCSTMLPGCDTCP